MHLIASKDEHVYRNDPDEQATLLGSAHVEVAVVRHPFTHLFVRAGITRLRRC